MVDAQLVAVVDRVDDLEEDLPDELVVAKVPLSLRDHPEEVSLLTELEDDVDAVLLLNDVVQSHDVAMVTREGVQRNLPPLERPLSLVESNLVEALDGVERLMSQRRMTPRRGIGGWPRSYIPREVDDAVRSQSKDRDKLETIPIDEVSDEVLRVTGVLGGHGCLGYCVRVGRWDSWEDRLGEVDVGRRIVRVERGGRRVS